MVILDIFKMSLLEEKKKTKQHTYVRLQIIWKFSWTRKSKQLGPTGLAY